MEYRVLGNTGISVSRLCFGSLTIGPLQANMSIKDGAGVIREAFDNGVNFIDTAELYKTYPYISEAIKDIRKDIVISTKCYAYTKKGAEESLNKALKELNTDYIDIFSLHEQESEHTVRGHYEAIEYFIKAKEKGLIRSIGISTHSVEGVKGATKFNEIEVIHPLINMAGLGIQQGSLFDMLEATKKAYDAGKGIYSMKAIGGGNLLRSYKQCLEFVLEKEYIHSIAVGMQSKDEVAANIGIFEGRLVDEEVENRIEKKERKIIIDFWCTGCGSCAAKCKSQAIDIVDNKAMVDTGKCLLCGYCGAYCPEFCIKII